MEGRHLPRHQCRFGSGLLHRPLVRCRRRWQLRTDRSRLGRVQHERRCRVLRLGTARLLLHHDRQRGHLDRRRFHNGGRHCRPLHGLGDQHLRAPGSGHTGHQRLGIRRQRRRIGRRTHGGDCQRTRRERQCLPPGALRGAASGTGREVGLRAFPELHREPAHPRTGGGVPQPDVHRHAGERQG